MEMNLYKESVYLQKRFHKLTWHMFGPYEHPYLREGQIEKTKWMAIESFSKITGRVSISIATDRSKYELCIGNTKIPNKYSLCKSVETIEECADIIEITAKEWIKEFSEEWS